MSTFQFAKRSVSLDFFGKLNFELPLNEELRNRVREAAQTAQQEADALKGSEMPENEKMEALADIMLDAVDVVLGEGTADRIIDAHGSDIAVWDAIDLFRYVTTEIGNAFAEVNNSLAATAKPAAPAPANRAQRRKHKHH